MVVIISDLTVQAEEAFVHVDLAVPFDRAHRTDCFASTASAPAFGMAFEHIKDPDLAKDCQPAAKRAGKPAMAASMAWMAIHRALRIALAGRAETSR